jgi:asparaginyl-tRNA synthetase
MGSPHAPPVAAAAAAAAADAPPWCAQSSDEAELAKLRAELAAREAKVKALEASIAQKESASGEGAFPYSASNLPGRVLCSTLLDAADGGASMAGQTVCIGGWVRTGREQGNNRFAFLEINDGSCFKNMQVIISKEVHELKPLIPIGTAIGVKGVITKLEGREQAVELQGTEVVYLAECAKGYPLFKGKSQMSAEAMREISHLRPRTNKFSATLRVRNSLAFATHEFFNKAGFYYMHAPLITASDCEGAGEMFQVTTLINEISEEKEGKPEGVLPPDTDGPSQEVVDKKIADVAQAQAKVDEKKAAGANKKKMKGELKNLEARKQELEVLQKEPATVAVRALALLLSP